MTRPRRLRDSPNLKCKLQRTAISVEPNTTVRSRATIASQSS